MNGFSVSGAVAKPPLPGLRPSFRPQVSPADVLSGRYVPVSVVAHFSNVSRQSVYRWAGSRSFNSRGLILVTIEDAKRYLRESQARIDARKGCAGSGGAAPA